MVVFVILCDAYPVSRVRFHAAGAARPEGWQ
jgi:hypothetical protein